MRRTFNSTTPRWPFWPLIAGAAACGLFWAVVLVAFALRH